MAKSNPFAGLSDDDLAAEVKRRKTQPKSRKRVAILEDDAAESFLEWLGVTSKDDDEDDDDDDEDDEGEPDDRKPKGGWFG